MKQLSFEMLFLSRLCNTSISSFIVCLTVAMATSICLPVCICVYLCCNVSVHISFYLIHTTISHLVPLLQVNRGGSEGIKEEDSIICEQFSV